MVIGVVASVQVGESCFVLFVQIDYNRGPELLLISKEYLHVEKRAGQFGVARGQAAGPG